MAESPLTNILVQLRIVSRIAEGEKLCSHEKLTIDTYRGYYQPIQRWFWGDSRDGTVQKLRELVEAVTYISKTIIGSKYLCIYMDGAPAPRQHDIDQHHILLNDLSEISDNIKLSMQGFHSLSVTYHGDAVVTSRLETLKRALMSQNDIIRSTIELATVS